MHKSISSDDGGEVRWHPHVVHQHSSKEQQEGGSSLQDQYKEASSRKVFIQPDKAGKVGYLITKLHYCFFPERSTFPRFL